MKRSNDMIPLNKEAAGAGEWECTECGSIEEGAKSRRPAKCPQPHPVPIRMPT